MPRYRITVAYDGTGLAGWQLQAGCTTIQGLLEDALFPFDNRRVVVTGAGRTDAGVHALAQVAAFTLEGAVAPDALVRALNARLPAAVRVMSACAVDDRFHPRFDAIAKTYRYRIFTGAVLSPFDYRYAWHLPGSLDAEAMNEAAAILVGEHDFAAFQGAGSETHTTVRVLHRSQVAPDPAGYVTYTASGEGFLRHMVRAIVMPAAARRRRRGCASSTSRIRRRLRLIVKTL